MTFTVIESSIGSVLIGLSIIFQLYFNGRISGMSGTIGTAAKFYKSKAEEWINRMFYIFGLVLGGWVLYIVPYFKSQAFNPQIQVNNVLLQEWFIYPIAGILIGFGTAQGSGCTSGHMLCGVARLSLRSILATITFCGTALVWVKVFNTPAMVSRFYGLKPDPLSVSLPSLGTGISMGIALFIILMIYIGILISQLYIFDSFFDRTPEDKVEDSKNVNILGMFNAFTFALGLGFSGMTKPQKVLGFFDLGPNWDPSLCCVIVFALLPALIIYQAFLLRNHKAGKEPLFTKKWFLPSSNQITFPLIFGSFLFGTGWGVLGICPGPNIVNLPTGAYEMILMFASVLVGIYMSDVYDSLVSNYSETFCFKK